jgi:hypothetical protein
MFLLLAHTCVEIGAYERIMDIYVQLFMGAVMHMHTYIISYPGWHSWYSE